MPAPIVSDSRFASLHSDPRFARKPRATPAAAVDDERFQAVAVDPRFADTSGPLRRKRPLPVAAAATTSDVAERGAENGGNQEEEDEGEGGAQNAPSTSRQSKRRAAISHESVDARLARLARMSRGEATVDDDALASEASDSSDDDAKGDANAESIFAAEDRDADLEFVVDPTAPDLTPAYMPGQSLRPRTIPLCAASTASRLDVITRLLVIPAYQTDGSETHRLAIVNLDWDHLRAVDILAALVSFVPPGGSILRVTVYPSEYGTRKIADEQTLGPNDIVFSKAAKLGDAPASAAPSAGRGASQPGPHASRRRGTNETRVGATGDDDDGFDPDRLRAYELNKLKYYYAVATCDSTATAIALYSACDGMEFEASSNIFDLRFIPDETQVPRVLRDEATDVPADYEPPKFYTAALQSSHVELTWDAEDPQRKRALNWDRLTAAGGGKKSADKKSRKQRHGRGQVTAGEADDDDEAGPLQEIVAYLAESESGESSGSDDDGSGKPVEKARLRALLLGESETASDGDVNGDSGDEDGGITMAVPPGKVQEITFAPDLAKTVAAERKAQAAAAGESTWDAYLRRRREKRKQKKEAHLLKLIATAGARQGDGVPVDGDAFFEASKAVGLGDTNLPVSRPAELELLTLGDAGGGSSDDEIDKRRRKNAHKPGNVGRQAIAEIALAAATTNSKRNYSVKALVRAEKDMSRAHARGATITAAAKTADDFALDTRDPRFAALLSKPEFAIDPTAPQYRATAGSKALISERVIHASHPGSENGKRPLVVLSGGSSALTSPVTVTTSVQELAKSIKSKFKSST